MWTELQFIKIVAGGGLLWWQKYAVVRAVLVMFSCAVDLSFCVIGWLCIVSGVISRWRRRECVALELYTSWEAVIIVVQGSEFSEESHTRAQYTQFSGINSNRVPIEYQWQALSQPVFPTHWYSTQQFAFHIPQSQVPHPHKTNRNDHFWGWFFAVCEWRGALNSLISHLFDRCRLHISLCLCWTCKVTEVGVIYPSDNEQSMALISNFRAAVVAPINR